MGLRDLVKPVPLPSLSFAAAVDFGFGAQAVILEG
jgi:hypothetical protein